MKQIFFLKRPIQQRMNTICYKKWQVRLKFLNCYLTSAAWLQRLGIIMKLTTESVNNLNTLSAARNVMPLPNEKKKRQLGKHYWMHKREFRSGCADSKNKWVYPQYYTKETFIGLEWLSVKPWIDVSSIVIIRSTFLLLSASAILYYITSHCI